MSLEITFCLEKLQFQRLLFCLIISLVNYPEQLLKAFYFSHQSSFSFPNAWKIILHSAPKQNNGSECPQIPFFPPALKPICISILISFLFARKEMSLKDQSL